MERSIRALVAVEGLDALDPSVRRLDQSQFEKAVLALAAVSAVPLLL